MQFGHPDQTRIRDGHRDVAVLGHEGRDLVDLGGKGEGDVEDAPRRTISSTSAGSPRPARWPRKPTSDTTASHVSSGGAMSFHSRRAPRAGDRRVRGVGNRQSQLDLDGGVRTCPELCQSSSAKCARFNSSSSIRQRGITRSRMPRKRSLCFGSIRWTIS